METLQMETLLMESVRLGSLLVANVVVTVASWHLHIRFEVNCDHDDPHHLGHNTPRQDTTLKIRDAPVSTHTRIRVCVTLSKYDGPMMS